MIDDATESYSHLYQENRLVTLLALVISLSKVIRAYSTWPYAISYKVVLNDWLSISVQNENV